MEHCRRTLLRLTLVVTLACWTLVSAQSDQIFSPPKIQDPKTMKTNYVANRGNVTLTCSASGIPTPTYTWRYRGGNPLQDMELPRIAKPDPNTGSLVLTDFTEREEGEYQCLASNEIQPGKKISAVAPAYTVKIIVLDAWPAVTKTVTVRNTGESATLTCESPPRSQPPGTFKWFQNDEDGKEIPISERVYIDNKGNLHFSYVEVSDSFEDLQCAIFNQVINSINLGSTRELQVLGGTLQESSPSILFYTQNATAMRNEATEMECVFSGYPVPAVSWFDPNNQPLGNSEKYQLTNENRKLRILRVQEEEEGTYTCRGSNTMGTTPQSIYLKVVSKPIPVEVLSDSTVPEYTDVRLPCKTRLVHGGKPQNSPVWTKNGNAFTADGVKTRYNADQTELIISNVSKPADISCYRCAISNEHGVFSADGCLNVIDRIRLTEVPPREQQINRGDTVNLTIRATTDKSMEPTLKTRVIFKGVTYEYNRNQLPPFMTYDSLTQVAFINTSALSDEDYPKVNGTYVLEVYHSYEKKSWPVLVLLKDSTVGPPGPVAAAVGDPWWIALLIGILLLIVVIVIICSVCWYRKMQEGVYPLDKTERAADLDPEKDLENAGFHDLSRADDDYAPTRPPPTSMLEDYPDSESDDEGSLREYGDLDTGKFNEDGSFIGVYGTNKPKKQPLPTESTI